MALYEINTGKAKLVRSSDFRLEKDLQRLIEGSLQTIFNCRLVATEFPTGSIHSGRIDTLAISEDNNPVIIEYKKVASSELINQSLYYLHWIKDHRGDYQVAVDKALGPGTVVDWSSIRVICIAPGYKKYDLHAAQVIGANIELWQYKLYENNTLNLEEVLKGSEDVHTDTENGQGKNPVMVEAGKKAAITRKTGVYTIEQHMEKLKGPMTELFNTIRDYITGLDDSVEETPKQDYIAYKTNQNFACLESRKSKLILYLKINPDEVTPLPKQARDVRTIGHFGTGDFELNISSPEDFEENKHLVNLSLKNIGG